MSIYYYWRLRLLPSMLPSIPSDPNPSVFSKIKGTRDNFGRTGGRRKPFIGDEACLKRVSVYPSWHDVEGFQIADFKLKASSGQSQLIIIIDRPHLSPPLSLFLWNTRTETNIIMRLPLTPLLLRLFLPLQISRDQHINTCVRTYLLVWEHHRVVW